MELEELKKAWAELDNRLKENKSINKAIIMEIARNKVDKSISRLINWEILGAVVLILMIPILLYMFHWFNRRIIVRDIILIYGGIFCCACVVWYIYKISGLMKIDFAKKISDNICYTNRYNIQIKREKFVMNVVFGPSFVILLILYYAVMKVNMQLWATLVCGILLVSLITYWMYKRLYDKNINSILKSLNEIKQLEETE